MNKTTFTLLLSSLLLLAACNSKNEQLVSDSSSAANTTTSSILKTSDSTSTSETKIISSSVSSEEQTVALSEEPQSSVPIPDMSQEQALQHILETYPDTNNEDTSLIFWQMIDTDFLFKAYSKSISSQGGSGTLGFFRVTPQGDVSMTDATGNPF